MKTYQEIVAYLESFIPKDKYLYPREKGLARMRQLLDVLGNPQKTYPAVHVVGTAGKGSTSTILAHILTTGGYKTGLDISPHLQVIPERTQIDGRFISIAELSQLIEEEVKPAVDKMRGGRLGPVSYYELLWAIALLYFAKQSVDIAVIEAGLGGTWDATNALTPLVGILTTVGLEHTEVLGPTIEDIARDKSGVVRKGITIVSGVKQESTWTIIEERCREKKARLLLLRRDFDYSIETMTDQGSHFTFTIGDRRYDNLFISLVGKHQVENAVLAIAAALQLADHGFRFQEDLIRKALATVRFPGRLEVVQKNPLVLLDGAHNPDKMQALADALSLYKPKKRIGVISFKRGKNSEQMLTTLLPCLDYLILTEFSVTVHEGQKWSIPAEDLARIVEKSIHLPYEIETNAIKAVQRALALAEKEDMVLVTGSLYLVGEVRNIWYPQKSLLR